jgi:methionyl-tRNA synthetase
MGVALNAPSLTQYRMRRGQVLSKSQKLQEAKVCDVNGDQVLIHYVKFDVKYDEWLPATSSRIKGIQLEVGSHIHVLSKSQKWQKGQVVAVNEESAQVQVHFEGFDVKYDEWIPATSQRLRPFTAHAAALPGQLQMVMKACVRASMCAM